MARSIIRVWVVDDNAAQRSAVCMLFEDAFDIRCTATFPHCEAALEAMDRGEEPDVILLDVELSPNGERMSGVEGAAVFRQRLGEVAIVMLTVKEDSNMVYGALEAGACGYLTKPPNIDEVINGIREAHRGGMCMSPPVARLVLQFFRDRKNTEEHDLTDRERDILRLMEQGKRQRQIAEALFLSRHTVDSHLRKIYQKLHVNSAAEAIARAIRRREI